ncbi:MAG: hypothetical protein IPK53_18400 [bacterium]|nr:hypothetical protein [bacterium]
MRIALTVLALSLLMAACSRDKSAAPDGVFEPLEFNVDSTLLGSVIEVGGVRLQAPAQWAEVDSSTFARILDVAARDTSELRLLPTYVFKHVSGGPMLLVSTFPRAVDLQRDFLAWAGEVARVYREQRKDIEVREQWINIAGVRALQLFSRSPQLIHAKIILHADQPSVSTIRFRSVCGPPKRAPSSHRSAPCAEFHQAIPVSFPLNKQEGQLA